MNKIRVATASCLLAVGSLGATVAATPTAVAAPGDTTTATRVADVDSWAWCGVHPDDAAAQVSATAMATSAGIDVTFGPCNIPTPDYTPAFTANRYVSPALYMRLVQINAAAGMKTVVYDARLWSSDAAIRDAALAFWAPVYPHIAAWDMGDEFDPNGPEWPILIERWNLVLAHAAMRSGIDPFSNHLPTAVGDALADLPGSNRLMSFARYGTDLGVSIARTHDAAIDTMMCGVNAFNHFGFVPTPASIRSASATLIANGCDQILVFGGARVYGGEASFGASSLVDRTGAATPWAAAALEAVGRSAYRPIGPARLLETRSGEGLSTVDGVAYGLGARPADTVTEVLIVGRARVPASATAVTVNLTVTNTAADGFVTLFPCGSALPAASQLNHGVGVTLSAAATVKLSPDGYLCAYNQAAADMVIDVVGYFPAGSSYTPLQPSRLLETRPAQPTGTIDGAFNELGVRGAGSVTELRVTGRAGVPTDVGSVVLNVTVTQTQGAGFVTVYACDQPRPTASQLNYVVGATITNSVIVDVSAAGTVCLFTFAAVDMVVDVAGHHPVGASVVPVQPARLLETRFGETTGTIDGDSTGIGRRPIDSITEVRIAGRGGVPDDAGSVVLSLTITEPVRAGFVVVYACDAPRPNAASINFAAGQTVANLVVTDVDQSGRICVFTMAPTHMIVDVAGYHP